MKRIKFVLTERWYTWENARIVAMDDRSIDLDADVDRGEVAYKPHAGENDAGANGGLTTT
jgi:large subunit ribosomal protein L47